MSKIKTILLVDSDLQDQEFFTGMIARVNTSIEVHTVPAGKDLLSYLQKCPADELPCLVVLDDTLPLLGPDELLPALSRDPRYNGISFAVWTSSADEEKRIRFRDAGAKALFKKPQSDFEAREQAMMMMELCDIVVGSGDTALPKTSL